MLSKDGFYLVRGSPGESGGGGYYLTKSVTERLYFSRAAHPVKAKLPPGLVIERTG